MKLADLLVEVEYECILGDVEKEVNDVVYDSRKAKEDNVFLCITGAVADGHTYIEKAVASGCSTFVIEKDLKELSENNRDALEKAKGITVIKTANNRKALSGMAKALFDYPERKLTTIAITGTKGKTTTSFMIRAILEEAGISTGVIGTTGIYFGNEHIETHNTTPESYEIQKYFAKMAENGCKACVMEVSSQALKLDRTAGIIFDYGIFTNMSPDHIGENEHKDYDEYVYCKSLLFRQCRKGIFNYDDKETVNMQKEASCEMFTYGFSKEADTHIENIEYIMEGGNIGIRIHTKGMVEDVFDVNTPGRFSAYNALAAIVVTKLIGVSDDDMKNAFPKVFVRGRVEAVKVSERFTVLIDYAHNAMSMESLLTTIKEYNPKRIVSLFGCGGNRSKLRRYEMGEISGKYADFSILTADNSRFEDVNDIIEDIKVGINKTDGKYIVIPDRREAIKYSIENAQDGDIVLLLGKGHEDYQEINGVRHPFDERVIIKEILEELQ